MIRRWSALGSLLLLSCVGTETGNPPVQSVALALRAGSSDTALATLDGSGFGPRLTAVELGVRAIRFVPCDQQAPVVVAESVTADLIQARTSVPVTVPIGTYCRVELDVAPSVTGQSVLMTGRLNGGLGFSVRLENERTIVLLPTDQQFTVSGDSALLLTFDMAAWLAMGPLGQATPGADQTVVVDSKTNPFTYQAIDSQVSNGADLYLDTNRNTVLDASEQPPIAAGP